VDTLTNVGTAYDTTAVSRGLGFRTIDLTGVTQLIMELRVNKIGTGTQSWQCWNDTDGAELGVITDAGAAGEKWLSATFTVAVTGTKRVRLRAKSTATTDDPIVYGVDLVEVRP
jgi:hypothetical protein